MKPSLALYLASASAQTFALDRRQQVPSGSSDLESTIKGIWAAVSGSFSSSGGSSLLDNISAMTGMSVNPVKTRTLKAELNTVAKRVEYTYGPFEILGQKDARDPTASKQTMDPTGINILKKLNGMCTGCTVLTAKGHLTFENGTIANATTGIYTHHLFTATIGKKALGALMCPNGDNPLGGGPISLSTFVAMGEDKPAFRFTTADGTFPSGYMLSATNPVVINSELVNYNDHKEKVYIAIDLEYLENQPGQYEDTAVTLLSVTDCAHNPEYKPPPGAKQHEKTSGRFIMPVDGTILNAMGHLHDGGTNLEMRINDKLVCNSTARYGRVFSTATMPMSHSHGGRRSRVMRRAEQAETIIAMSPCTDSISVKKGDAITVTSKYDLIAHPLRESGGEEMGGMGIFILTMAHGPLS